MEGGAVGDGPQRLPGHVRPLRGGEDGPGVPGPDQPVHVPDLACWLTENCRDLQYVVLLRSDFYMLDVSVPRQVSPVEIPLSLLTY